MRIRRTAAQIAQLEKQILDILEDDHPQSVRHVFYRLTDHRLEVSIDKTEAGYGQVQQRLVKMRRSGDLPYGWIADSSRLGYHVDQFENIGQFVASVASLYRQTLWSDDLPLVEVWCESRSIASVIKAVCRETAVSLFPTGGFSSLSFVYEAATKANELGRPLVVLYLGDLDPSGVWIDRSLESEMRKHLTVELDFRRLAITPEQVSTYDLPSRPRKASEKRSPDLQLAVEAESLQAGILRTLVRDTVESYLPTGQLEAVKVAEAAEREQLEDLGFRLWEHGLAAL